MVYSRTEVASMSTHMARLALDKIMTIATPLAPVAVGLVVEEVRSTKRRPHHD